MEQFEKRVSEPGIGYFTDTISLVKSPVPAVWVSYFESVETEVQSVLSPGQYVRKELSRRAGRFSRRFEPPSLQDKRQLHSRFVLEAGLFAPTGISHCRGL